MKKFAALSATYSYLTDDNDEDKKAKGRKNCVIKQRVELEDDENCLEATRRK